MVGKEVWKMKCLLVVCTYQGMKSLDAWARSFKKKGILTMTLTNDKGRMEKIKNIAVVLCNKNIPLRLKGRVYCIVVRPVLFYGAKCSPIKKTQV